MNAEWPAVAVVSAPGIAAALGLPPPTAAQCAVIEAPPHPALVVAGAGSGKTETMAGRVVWLIANGHVARDEVLGLTFTRKAAGELAERIDRRLAVVDEFQRRGLLPHIERLMADGSLSAHWESVRGRSARASRQALAAFLDAAAARSGVAVTAAPVGDLLVRPRVATYNAFADAIVREHGARIGRDAGSALLGQSGSWLLARRTVVASGDARLAARGEAFSTVVDAVHTLAGEVLDNRVDLDRLDAFAAEWAAGIEPLTNPALQAPGHIEKFQAAMTGLPVLTRLAREYAARKAASDTLDFADQVAGALAIAESSPDVVADLRDQYRVVLLDEYQDTSVVQTQLLATVFRDTPVMAVGDPNQSIYGWRGASADNLRAFPAAFSGVGDCGHHRLMISWRNDVAVLRAANRLVRGRADDVGQLEPRPGASAGEVSVRFPLTIEEEAEEVARWFVDVRTRHEDAHPGRPHAGAVLFRAKRHMNVFAEALGRAGVPHRILGLGGLLATPEVVDVVAALRVVHDPSQGSALIRILSGPRFAVGVADLAALRDLADTLSRRDAALAPLPPELASRVRGSAGADETLSIVDALEFVRTAGTGHRLLGDLSDMGRARLREAGEMFERLRRAVGQPIPDLVRLIELELRLDIELAANESRGPARVASAQLRAFLDEVRAFLDADESGGIPSLLSWLEHAEDTDELMPRAEPPQPGVVQLLTIHGAKGLEWDAVAVVRLVEKELPKAPRTKLGWTGFGVLPYPFRGDAGALPHLDWRPHDGDAKALRAALKDFHTANGEHQAGEERRLAYVAVTRARSDLLLSGSQWGGQRETRRPSDYLQEIVEALGLPAVELTDPGENPFLGREGRVVSWPLDPLGDRGDTVVRAADAVRAAEVDEPDELLARLLSERDARAQREGVVPVRVPASRFKDYVNAYADTARSLSRPMPERPFRQAVLGTRFHSWVERRSDRVAAGPSPDDALWEIDDDADGSSLDAEDFARLTAAFDRSEWGRLAPISIESQIDFVLPAAGGDRIVVCKLDAVYRREDRGGRIEIVDWKTGRAPAGERETEDRLLQLELYRHAYHTRHGIPLEEIDVALFYVAHDLVIRPRTTYSLSDLAQRWSAARSASR